MAVNQKSKFPFEPPFGQFIMVVKKFNASAVRLSVSAGIVSDLKRASMLLNQVLLADAIVNHSYK